eukprot:2836913-Rhodomonas_salina.2
MKKRAKDALLWCSSAASCLCLPANPFHSLCCLAASGWPSSALSCVHDTHSGCLPSFFTRVLCCQCVLSSLGGTGDAAELSTTKAQLQQTITLNIQSRGRSKTQLPGSRTQSAPSQAFPALDVSLQSGSGWTRTGHSGWHPRLQCFDTCRLSRREPVVPRGRD